MINPEKFYTITQIAELAQEGYVPFKGKDKWRELINKGELSATIKGPEHRKTFLVQGKDLLIFLDGLRIRRNQE